MCDAFHICMYALSKKYVMYVIWNFKIFPKNIKMLPLSVKVETKKDHKKLFELNENMNIKETIFIFI